MLMAFIQSPVLVTEAVDTFPFFVISCDIISGVLNEVSGDHCVDIQSGEFVCDPKLKLGEEMERSIVAFLQDAEILASAVPSKRKTQIGFPQPLPLSDNYWDNFIGQLSGLQMFF
jgi:hypothetical protein